MCPPYPGKVPIFLSCGVDIFLFDSKPCRRFYTSILFLFCWDLFPLRRGRRRFFDVKISGEKKERKKVFRPSLYLLLPLRWRPTCRSERMSDRTIKLGLGKRKNGFLGILFFFSYWLLSFRVTVTGTVIELAQKSYFSCCNQQTFPPIFRLAFFVLFMSRQDIESSK